MALIAIGLGLSGWPHPSLAAPRLQVAATIFPLYDLVRQVGGPDVETVLVLPPGASPHTVAFTPSMIRSLTGSAAIFAIGHGLDDWAVRLAADAGVPRTVRTDARIALRSGYEGGHVHGAEDEPRQQAEAPGSADPHYWLAIPNAMQMVQTIASVLGELDPAGKSGYEQRAAVYRHELQVADRAIRQRFAEVLRHDIALFHSAFDYFAAAYGVRIVATFEPIPGQEPGPRHVREFLRRLREHNLRVLFIEPQLNAAPLRSLARDIGVNLQELDPLGGIEGRQSYLALMRFNASQIASALRE
jgi:zinc transport system substrate-binding protein